MRDILFRGKSIDYGSWENGDLIKSIGKTYIGNTLGNNREDWVEVIPESVGQFIGLPDKNGVKIFDGDVLENEDGDEVCHTLIFWDKDLSSWSDCRYFDGDSFKIHNGDMLWVLDCEVIGNIFDSPDLIKYY